MGVRNNNNNNRHVWQQFLSLLLLVSTVASSSSSPRHLRRQRRLNFFSATPTTTTSHRYAQCRAALGAADTNGNGRLSRDEFAQVFSTTNFADLDITYVMAFYTTACSICYAANENDNDDDDDDDDQCCVGERAVIPIDDPSTLPGILDFVCPIVGMDDDDDDPVVALITPSPVSLAATTPSPTTVAPITTETPVVVVPPFEATFVPTEPLPTPTAFPTIVVPTPPPTLRPANPTAFPTIVIPTVQPTTSPPSMAPTTSFPTNTPTQSPTRIDQVVLPPTPPPTTVSPTLSPTTVAPTLAPTTQSPTLAPTTVSPTPPPPVCISFAYTVATVSTVTADDIQNARNGNTIVARLTRATETIVTDVIGLALVSVTIDTVVPDNTACNADTMDTSCVIVASTVCVVSSDDSDSDNRRTILREGLRTAVDGNSFQDAIPPERRRQ